ncbi:MULTISPECIES: hypothetical protein [unclassified Bradyrhizobium]|uniref:hypothetical protein n=1 Tax=unclassified Bradyrhizobium TaxID=2631580 RepID=UPI00247921E9|nr:MULTISPECIES: hypothetical protein [unclassified Bradyrhizobium]WGS21041.1 hypothetical protein MTX22_04490 [Bradyrhizobium sp. ISRA463]WGS27955.1 hypothetical protein MTX19_02340 [Bradyrhizobium sp. ISRA464]
MGFHRIAGAACRALTAKKDGPSLYDVCDPLLLKYQGGDAHLGQFYRTALGNPALRPLLRRTGVPALKDPARLDRLRAALTAARDDATPDWAAIGAPVAELIDGIDVRHPQPPAAAAPGRAPDMAEIDRVIRSCGAHLLRSFARCGFIPTYAAFNLLGDADISGREMLMALTGLNARGYKNSTLLFSLARIFIAHSPARALINPPWRGIAEPMWEPVQIRHRSAYYDAFFTEALLGFLETGLASSDQTKAARRAISDMVDFCLKTSAEEVPSHDGSVVKVITALAPGRHPRFSRFFAQIKQDLGFGIYVPDCDTTACSFSAATQAGADDPILAQPLVDFYRGYQVRSGANEPRVTVPLNDNIDYEGGVVTWIDNLDGDRPYGNDLDPTLNLDILEVSFRNLKRWNIIETPQRLETLHRIIAFQKRLVESGAFKHPRSHIYYLPELYSAYFGRCYAAFIALPLAAQRVIDPGNVFALIRARVLGYVMNELITHEMNPFDAALALMALAHLNAEVASFTPALHCIVQTIGEGGRRGPYRAYEWNKMKTPTRILVGGPEVTSAFVLMALALARKRMAAS